jgi:hypothetical protein
VSRLAEADRKELKMMSEVVHRIKFFAPPRE